MRCIVKDTFSPFFFSSVLSFSPLSLSLSPRVASPLRSSSHFPFIPPFFFSAVMFVRSVRSLAVSAARLSQRTASFTPIASASAAVAQVRRHRDRKRRGRHREGEAQARIEEFAFLTVFYVNPPSCCLCAFFPLVSVLSMFLLLVSLPASFSTAPSRRIPPI